MNEERYAKLRLHSEEQNKLVKDCLRQALLQLIGKKEYKAITVTEICKKAGVSRTAFYTNFGSIDAILSDAMKSFHEEMMQRAGSPFRTDTTREWYKKFFSFIEEKEHIIGIFFKAEFQTEYLNWLNKTVLHDENASAAKKYSRLIWSGAMVNVVSYWLRTDKKEPIDDITNYCFNNLPKIYTI